MNTSWSHFIALFIVLAGNEASIAADSRSREYTVRGTVVSKIYFYDADKNLKQPPVGFPADTKCDFVFYRRFSKWRLNIEQPDPAFPEGSIWEAIMPFRQKGFVSVISYPPRPGVPANKGNASVTVITNEFYPPGDAYGKHAIWLVVNLDDILEKAARTGVGPPIWQFNPLMHDMRVNSHMITRKDDAVMFWNTGKFAARDANGQIILENGQPKMNIRPPPLDKGFIETEYRPSGDFRSQQLGIPKSVVVTTFAPVRDEKEPGGFRRVPLREHRIENREVESQPIPESLFVPAWTNQLGMVTDPRAEGAIPAQPLTYITKSNYFDPSDRELNRRKQEVDTQKAIAQPPRRIPKSIIILSLLIATLTPLGLWRYARKK
jgi:hypothetical protein